MNCENCGLPEGALPDPGLQIKITRHAENGFHRDKTVSVWCCSRECAIEALAVSKFGPASHKWPITLAQFRSGVEL